jgi:hypothetical protein
MTKLATFGIKCGHCKERHLTAQEVRDCYAAGKAAPEPTPRITHEPMATEPQIRYVRNMIAQKDMPEATRELVRETLAKGLTFEKAQQIIPILKRFPWAPKERKERAEDGMYWMPEVGIFRVQTAPGTDFRMAKRLKVIDLGNGKKKGRFERQDNMVYKLKPEHRMTEEEAVKYGALYGFCIVCGRTLTDEDSIAAGIGPVCAEKV